MTADASKAATPHSSPAEDYLEGPLNLNEYLVKHPAATFFVRVTGDSMIGAGMHPGDLLLVDRALTPRHWNVVITVVDGDLTVKRLWHCDGTVRLMPDNGHYEPPWTMRATRRSPRYTTRWDDLVRVRAG